MSANVSSPTTTDPALRRWRWTAFIAVVIAVVLNLLDATVIAVASPSIRADLGGGAVFIAWSANAYTLALAAGVLVGARLGDRIGRRNAFLIGLTVFTVASALCACAWSPTSFVVFRLLQGLGSALMVPQAFGLIRDLFTAREAGKAFGVLGPAIGAATVLGPVVAGLLISANIAGLDWRSVFLLNVPMGIAAGAIAIALLPRRDPIAERPQIDLLGALIAAIGMGLVVFSLVGAAEGMSLWRWATLVSGVVVIVVFLLHQRARSTRGKSPLVELTVFRKRSYLAGVGFVLLFFAAIAGYTMTIGVYLQLGEHITPLGSSLFLMAWALGSFVGSGVAGSLQKQLGRRLIFIGLIVVVVGLTALAVAFAVAGKLGASAQWWFVPALVAYGIGMGMVFIPLFDIIMGAIDNHEVGSAAGVLESVQQLGSTIGVAVIAGSFLSTTIVSTASANGAALVSTFVALGAIAGTAVLSTFLPRRAADRGA